jgi:predicted Zn-dependent peptidase
MSDGKGVDWLQEYPARLAATTPEDVQEAAARMLAPLQWSRSWSATPTWSSRVWRP